MSDPNEMHYHVTYNVAREDPPLSKAAAIEKNKVTGGGFATAIVIGSVLYPENGEYSSSFYSLDGRTGKPLDAPEMWKAWVTWAMQLAQDETLSRAKRALCRLVVREIFGPTEKPPLGRAPYPEPHSVRIVIDIAEAFVELVEHAREEGAEKYVSQMKLDGEMVNTTINAADLVRDLRELLEELRRLYRASDRAVSEANGIVAHARVHDCAGVDCATCGAGYRAQQIVEVLGGDHG